MLTVADLFGVPESLVDDFTLAGDRWASAQDPAVRPAGVTVPEFMMTQVDILQKIGVEVVHHRRAHPADDLATALGRATMGGRTLDDSEIGTVVLLLSVAGNDTTKQTTGWAMHQLWTHPDQKQLLADDYDGMIAGAIEEFIRHTSPVQRFARTAKKDVTLGDVEIKKYDKVLMLYASGNRDETVFDDPWRFDITRGRTPHVGFGGGGVHYCLGNAVAKAQLRALFQQFLTKLWDMEVGEPEFLRSDSFNGFRTFPVRIP
ncbi:cytochrome P450 [Rhodococcus koreensis]